MEDRGLNLRFSGTIRQVLWIATTTEKRLASAKQREAAEQLQIKLISAHSGLTASRGQKSQSASTPPSARASARSRPFCRPECGARRTKLRAIVTPQISIVIWKPTS